MERFLLFDSGCSLCAELARAIERESGGWLVVRSLREPAVQTQLDRVRANWRWEPTLLEIEGDRASVFTGIALRVRLAIGLGPKRAWHLLEMVRTTSRPMVGSDQSRRQFLQKSGIVVAGVTLAGILRPFRMGVAEGEVQANAPRLNSALSSAGEEYAGFLLLPEGSPVPAFIQYPRLGIPVVCGVGVGRGGVTPTAVSIPLNTAADVAQKGGFPMCTFRTVPDGLQSAGAYLIKHPSGEVFGGSVNFQSYRPEIGTWDSDVSIWAQPDFPRPFPLWSSSPPEPGAPAVILEKVNFLPSPGIMTATQAGYVFHWIQGDVYYTLRAEYGPSREQAKALASSLVSIN